MAQQQFTGQPDGMAGHPQQYETTSEFTSSAPIQAHPQAQFAQEPIQQAPMQSFEQPPQQSFPPPPGAPPTGQGFQHPHEQTFQPPPHPPPGRGFQEQVPVLPQRHPEHHNETIAMPPTQIHPNLKAQQDVSAFPPPPQRHAQNFGDDDPSNPIHYTRDPHKLIAYLVPFPKPQVHGVEPANIPSRFLIYTPPPPPLGKPNEGDKEAKLHKVQRKWQEEVRGAKSSTAKTASWQGMKSKVTRGISKAMAHTTTSNLDFLGRVSDNKSESGSDDDHHANDGHTEGETTHKTVGVEEMVLVYPTTMGMTEDEVRAEFVNTMLRTKNKAMRDSVISTGLMPVAYGIDIMATLVWPFGGLGEIDTVWAYANIRGAKTARSVTKRLSSSSDTGDHEKDQLRLKFAASKRIDVLDRYLAASCHKVDPKQFPSFNMAPTESDVLEAIGWNPHQSGGESHNWEDEQWETTEVKDDLKLVMHKGAKEWKKWCIRFEKNPEKALKK